MATNLLLALPQQPKKGGLSLFNLSAREILDQIFATHVHDERTFNVESLFIAVANALERSAQIADKFVLGSQGTAEHMEEKIPILRFSPLFCTLKRISCEMQCQAAGEVTAYKTALSILNKLSNYSWDAKAVLTLAAFALDYGEFWLLYETQSTDQLAESIGTLRGIPVLSKKHKQELYELNNMVRDTVKLMKCIFKLERLLNQYAPKEVPALSTAKDHIPVGVFWIIVTVVASTTQFCYLTSDGENKQQLSQFQQQLNNIRGELESQIAEAEEKIAEIERFKMLQRIFATPTEIIEALKALIYAEDMVALSDGVSGKLVDIDVLKGKNILLFISRLDISDSDIEIMKQSYEFIRKENQYKIVWIPIVNQWTEELQKFEIQRSKMPWYVVPNFSSKAGINFVKEEWHFTGKPQVVVLNPKTKLEHQNAMHMISVWGTEAFPFTKQKEQELLHRSDWFWSTVSSLYPHIRIKEQKYIFFYGGKDNEWVQNFQALVKEVVITGTKTAIDLQCVGEGSKEDDHGILGGFWTRIESTFLRKINGKLEKDSEMAEIQKLFSFKNASGWAVLTKESNLVLSGHGTTILKALKDFANWKGTACEKGFEFAFKEYHNKVVNTSHLCCRIDIENISGQIPEHLKCADCNRFMEKYISFNCCHTNRAANGLH